MHVLILGGDGFIGSHLLQKHLDNGDTCTIVDIETLRTNHKSKDYSYIHCDLSLSIKKNIKLIDKIKPDLIYNCVAIANPSFYVKYPKETFELDFKINYENIIKPIIATEIPLVHFSTSEIYGKKWNEPYNEDKTNLIIGPTQKSRWIYATSKILLEQLLLAEKSKFIIIRPQNFIGWNMDWLPDMENNTNKFWIPRLPACFLNALFYDKDLYIVNPGTQKRCYTHISDAVDCIYNLVQSFELCEGEVFNVGNNANEISITELAHLFITLWFEYTGKQHNKIKNINGEDFFGEGYEDCERRFFSDEKIKNYIFWEPKINIKDTIAKTIEDAIKNYK